MSDEGGDGVTQQVEFLKTALVSRVNREFRWWKGKDKPVVSNINVRKLQNVSDECAVFVGIGAIDNGMASSNHWIEILLGLWPFKMTVMVLQMASLAEKDNLKTF